MEELKGRLVYVIPSEREKYLYEKALFGEEEYEAFSYPMETFPRKFKENIIEACKCLALGRFEAFFFHYCRAAREAVTFYTQYYHLTSASSEAFHNNPDLPIIEHLIEDFENHLDLFLAERNVFGVIEHTRPALSNLATVTRDMRTKYVKLTEENVRAELENPRQP